MVDLDEIIGSRGVAELAGLSDAGHVSDYVARGILPAPRKWLGPRCPLWIRSEVRAHLDSRP